MKDSQEDSEFKLIQTTLDQNGGNADDESDYEHLVQHLIEQDTDIKDTN